MPLTKSTKAELLEKIEAKESEIKDLKKEISDLKKYEQYKNAGDELYYAKSALVDSGFTHVEAFELLKIMIDKTLPSIG